MERDGYYRIAGPSPGLHISQKDEMRWKMMRNWAEGVAVHLLEFDHDNTSLCVCQLLEKNNCGISMLWLPYSWLAPMTAIVIEAQQFYFRHDTEGCFIIDCDEKTVNGR